MIGLLEVTRSERERGFTLVELLVVILIIGVLTAVAVPMFMNQRKAAVESTLHQDLKNAGTILQGATIKTQGKYPAALPDYSKFSEGNSILVMPTHSNKEQACLMAKNSSHPDLSAYYSTSGGGVLPSGQTCEATTQPSYAAENTNKKVAIIKAGAATTSVDAFRDSLIAQGYAPTNITVSTQGQNAVTTANMSQYEIIIFAFQAWHMSGTERALAEAFYDIGGRVIIEGNDNTWGHMPRWAASSISLSPSAGTVNYNPTYNSIDPSFPYTFSAKAFNPDIWSCVTALKAGTHEIASSLVNNGTQKCITMAASSQGNGRMVYIVMAHKDYPTLEVSPAYAAVSWLSS